MLVAGLLAIAFIGFAITILIKKRGKFPELHIGRNKNMKQKGIHCTRTTDRLDRTNYIPINIEEHSKHETH